jgi:cell division protein FtsW (lipid II flippase)
MMQQQQGTGYSQPAPYHPPPPVQPGLHYLHLVYIGIVILLISGIIFSLSYTADDSDTDETIYMLGLALNEVGLGVLAFGLVMGAFKDENLHHWVRVAMIVAMAFLIAYVHYY